MPKRCPYPAPASGAGEAQEGDNAALFARAPPLPAHLPAPLLALLQRQMAERAAAAQAAAAPLPRPPGVVQLAVRRLLRLHVHLNFRALLQLGVLLALVYQVRPRCTACTRCATL